MVNKSKIKYNNCCNSRFRDKIFDLIDGSLKTSEIDSIKEHILECEDCSKFYNLQIKSKESITSLKQNKINYVNNLSRDKENFQIDQIMKKINEESNNKKKITIKGFFFNNINTLSKTAAFLVLAIFISLISLNYSGILNKNSDLGTNETATGDFNSKEMLEENDYRNESQSGPEVASPIESDAAFMLLDHYLSSEKHDLIFENYERAIEYIEVNNSIYDYIAILKYYTNEIDDQIENFENIFENENYSVELKTIAGENEQKLLEYVSEEQIKYLDSYFDLDQISYVVILINR